MFQSFSLAQSSPDSFFVLFFLLPEFKLSFSFFYWPTCDFYTTGYILAIDSLKIQNVTILPPKTSPSLDLFLVVPSSTVKLSEIHLYQEPLILLHRAKSPLR